MIDYKKIKSMLLRISNAIGDTLQLPDDRTEFNYLLRTLSKAGGCIKEDVQQEDIDSTENDLLECERLLNYRRLRKKITEQVFDDKKENNIYIDAHYIMDTMRRLLSDNNRPEFLAKDYADYRKKRIFEEDILKFNDLYNFSEKAKELRLAYKSSKKGKDRQEAFNKAYDYWINEAASNESMRKYWEEKTGKTWEGTLKSHANTTDYRDEFICNIILKRTFNRKSPDSVADILNKEYRKQTDKSIESSQ